MTTTPTLKRAFTRAFSALVALSFVGARGCVFDGDVSLGDNGHAGSPVGAAGVGGSMQAGAGHGGSTSTGAVGGGSSASAGSGSSTGGSGQSGAPATSGGSSANSTGGSDLSGAGEAGMPGSTGGTTALGGMGGSGATGGIGATGGSGPVWAPPPSCEGFSGTECQRGDCCEVITVPGGTVTVGETEQSVPTFGLDKYEVTVARFRSFMNVVDAWEAAGNPVEGAGAHPDVPGSGWHGVWLDQLNGFGVGLRPFWMDSPLPENGFTSGYPVYAIPGAGDLAVNWVPFPIAYAFCIWDGGRLPASAEWLRAALGDPQTLYPWGDSPTPKEMFVDRPEPSIPTPYDDSYWQYIGIAVGSHPASAGPFGHQDLAAGLWEFVRDAVPASDVTPLGGLIELATDEELGAFEPNRGQLGGNWETPAYLKLYGIQGMGAGTIGIRCARDVP